MKRNPWKRIKGYAGDHGLGYRPSIAACNHDVIVTLYPHVVANRRMVDMKILVGDNTGMCEYGCVHNVHTRKVNLLGTS